MNRLLERNLNWLKSQGISAGQNLDDLEQLYEFMLGRPRTSVFVEIGVWRGGTLLLLSQFVREGGLVVGVDKYGNVARNDRRNRQMAETVAQRLRDIRNLDVHIVPKLSVDAIDDVKEILGGRDVDHLHIDGDHTYAGARTDFETYSPLVRKGGIVQLHDICTSPDVLGPQPSLEDSRGFVQQYWKDLKSEYVDRTIEFANNTENPAFTGIGIVRM
jgi:cephalosporin hydroxylase